MILSNLSRGASWARVPLSKSPAGNLATVPNRDRKQTQNHTKTLALFSFRWYVFSCVRPSEVIGKHCNFVALLALSFVFPDVSCSYRVHVFFRVGPSDVTGKHCTFVALLALRSVFLDASSCFSVVVFIRVWAIIHHRKTLQLCRIASAEFCVCRCVVYF